MASKKSLEGKKHSTRKVPDSFPHNEWQPSWNL